MLSPSFSHENLHQSVVDHDQVHTLLSELLPQSRDERVAKFQNITGGFDAAGFVTAVHHAIRPHDDMSPTPYQTEIRNRNTDELIATMASPEERWQIIQTAADLITQLGSDIKPGFDFFFLERAGDIMALATVLAHPFEDGNGSTARVIAEIITNGTPNERRSRLLTLSTERKMYDTNPVLPFSPLITGKSNIELLRKMSVLEIPLINITDYALQSVKLFTSPEH
jgi:hypothetical protein